MKLSEDIGKDVVDSGVISYEKVEELVGKKKISIVQTSCCDDCTIDIALSDGIINYGNSEFLRINTHIAVVQSTWNMCSTAKLNLVVSNVSIVVLVLKLKNDPEADYIAIAMLESEFNS